MQNTKILKMLNNGEIEKLKELLTEEIYQDSLKGNGNAKNRYAAMKRYFKGSSKEFREMFKYPCKDVKVGEKMYNSFTDGYCFALTTENIDTLETFDKTKGDYLDMNKCVNLSMANSVEKINFKNLFAEAKLKGYKYKKSECSSKDCTFVMKHRDTFYTLALLDKSFSIINDGEVTEIYYTGVKQPLYIKTSIGISGVMPCRFNEKELKNKTIICTENFKYC